MATHTDRAIVERDYTKENTIAFIEECPLLLQDRIDRNVVIKTLTEINKILSGAYEAKIKSGLLFIGNILTFGLLHLFTESPLTNCIHEAEDLITAQNREIYNPAGIQILNLTETSLLHQNMFQEIMKKWNVAIDEAASVEVRRDAAQSLIEIVQNTKKKEVSSLSDFSKNTKWNSKIQEIIAMVGDYELQTLLLSFLWIVKRLCNNIGMKLDIMGTEFNEFMLIKSKPNTSGLRKVLNTINNINRVCSFPISLVFYAGTRFLAEDLWVDFNMETFSMNLLEPSTKEIFLLDISYLSIISWEINLEDSEIIVKLEGDSNLLNLLLKNGKDLNQVLHVLKERCAKKRSKVSISNLPISGYILPFTSCSIAESNSEVNQPPPLLSPASSSITISQKRESGGDIFIATEGQISSVPDVIYEDKTNFQNYKGTVKTRRESAIDSGTCTVLYNDQCEERVEDFLEPSIYRLQNKLDNLVEHGLKKVRKWGRKVAKRRLKLTSSQTKNTMLMLSSMKKPKFSFKASEIGDFPSGSKDLKSVLDAVVFPKFVIDQIRI